MARPADGGNNALSYAQLVALATKHGANAKEAQTLASIALAESSGRAAASNKNTNASTDYGLWQINSVHRADGFDPAKALDPDYNVTWAIKLMHDSKGFTPWDSSKAKWAPAVAAQTGAPVAAAKTASGSISADLDQRLAAMKAASPFAFGVGSEVRTKAEQTALWNTALTKYGSAAEARKWVAPPGTSQHEKGHAADLQFSTPAAREWAHANASKFGLVFPLSNEAWHVEVAGSRNVPAGVVSESGAVAPSQATGAAGMTTGTLPANASPADVQKFAEEHYPDIAPYLHDKELGPVLLQAAQEGWSDARLQGALQKTNFWKTHSQAQRTYDLQNSTDHATVHAKVQDTMSTVTAAALRNGITLTGLQAHDLAVKSLRNGWSSDALDGFIRAAGKPSVAQTAMNFGDYAKLAGTVPEIKALLDQATKAGWSGQQFQAALQSTNWWKTSTDAQKKAQLTAATDPAQSGRDKQQVHDQIVTAARNLGVADGNPGLGPLIDDAHSKGLDQSEVQRRLADLVKVGSTGNTGQTAITVASLKQQAANYLVSISDATLSQWVNQIQRGDVPAASFDSYLKEQAKSLFPGMATAIDSGVTPGQYVDPYKQLAAQTLEINPETVNFSDPKWAKALFQVDPKTGARTSMSLADWGTTLRSDPSYGYAKTKGAVQQGSDFAEQILNTFGAVGNYGGNG